MYIPSVYHSYNRLKRVGFYKWGKFLSVARRTIAFNYIFHAEAESRQNKIKFYSCISNRYIIIYQTNVSISRVHIVVEWAVLLDYIVNTAIWAQLLFRKCKLNQISDISIYKIRFEKENFSDDNSLKLNEWWLK